MRRRAKVQTRGRRKERNGKSRKSQRRRWRTLTSLRLDWKRNHVS